MKIAAQAENELIHLGKLLKNMHIGMLTNVDEKGALVSRPMSAVEMDSKGRLWFFTDIHSGKVGHLNQCNLSFTDEANSTYVSISGHCEINTDKKNIERLWTSFVRPWFPDGPDSPNIALLEFIPNAAEYWDAPNSKMVRLFAMAASIAVARPIGMGDHDTLTDLGDSH